MTGVADYLQKAHVQIGILAGTLILYLLVYNFSPGLGVFLLVLIFIEIIGMVAIEIRQGAKESGWKHELQDTLLALAVAVGIWLGASFILNTSSPISAVVSCSMLPNLQRGDFVIVQGAEPQAYDISMSREEFSALSGGAPMVTWAGGTAVVNGSIYSYCSYEPNMVTSMCQDFVSNPEQFTEQSGPFTYNYARCRVDYPTQSRYAYGPCVESVTFRGKEYSMNLSHDIVVYGSDSDSLFSKIGDIVHRVVFAIDVEGKKYYLTKGDNNPILDSQVFDYERYHMGNKPIPQRNLKGKVIFRVPFLGYYKLVISLNFEADKQCGQQLSYEHV